MQPAKRAKLDHKRSKLDKQLEATAEPATSTMDQGAAKYGTFDMELLFGKTLVTPKTGDVATAERLKGADVVGIYFSAHWCPPCRKFTPKLAQVYQRLTAAEKSFEIVFVSSDQNQSQFDTYHKESMPWSVKRKS